MSCCQPTGVFVRAGDIINVTAKEKRTIYGDKHSFCGPEGASQWGKFGGINYGSLVGKIGSQGSKFYVGASSEFIAPVSGELFLGIWDSDSGYQDNSGEVVATITIKSHKFPNCL